MIAEPEYPLQRLLGFRMRSWDAERAVFELPVGEHLHNRHGIPHGGVYATLLDTVMGYAGCFTGDPATRRNAITLSMTTNFLSRPKGALMIGTGWRAGGGASTFFAEGRIEDETGITLATGTAVYRYRKTSPA